MPHKLIPVETATDDNNTPIPHKLTPAGMLYPATSMSEGRIRLVAYVIG